MDKRESCRKLWKECFGDSESYMDYYFTEKWKNNIVFTKEETDEVVSMVHLNPYSLCYKGKKVESYYIVGVATKKEYRKKGNMRQLLEQSFSFMKESGIKLTYLMPVDRKIYEPFGFRFIYEQERYRLHKIKRNWDFTSGVKSKTIEELSTEELEKLLSFCERILQKEFDLYVIRGQEYYTNLQKEMKASCGAVRVFFKKNHIVGILAYGREKGVLEITESLIDFNYTREILMAFFSIEDETEAYFLESHFLDKAVLEESAEWVQKETVPIIMAKMLEDTEEAESIWRGQRVYLNEIV